MNDSNYQHSKIVSEEEHLLFRKRESDLQNQLIDLEKRAETIKIELKKARKEEIRAIAKVILEKWKINPSYVNGIPFLGLFITGEEKPK